VTETEIREQFFRTRDAATAISSRTARVDDLVRQRWQRMPPELALVAVGGYGRSELFPYSDIDLLILTPDEKTQLAIKEPLSIFLRDLWDQKLRISQSVHTPVDCNQIDAANAELAKWVKEGRLKHTADIVDGLENKITAFRKLFTPGAPHMGKLLVRVDPAAN